MEMPSIPTGDELSKLIQNSLTKLDPSIFKSLTKLSTALGALSSMHEALSGTSSSPHPYVRLKNEYLDTDYTPLSFNEIKAPENFSLEECSKKLKEIQNKIGQTNTNKISAIKNFDLKTNDINFKNIENYFTTLSSNQFVLQKDRAKQFLQFVETLRTIEQSVGKENPIQLAQKIVTHYIDKVGPIL